MAAVAPLRRLVVAFVLAALLVPASARASHQGCYVYGEVMGLDVIRTCTYTAATPQQAVHVATPNQWRVWVERLDEQGRPVEVVLAEGHGPVAGAPPLIRPFVGERVNVSMFAGCDVGFLCGTMGLLEAGIADGH